MSLRPAARACARPVLGGLLIAGSAVAVHSVFDAPLPTLLVGGAVAALLYLPVVYPMRAMLPGRAKEGATA
ncbi:hypothetical protein ACFQV2_36795 [Actinokineospora soli]|uniref:Uncharacterized protein n=1 Tax=Actinokineospora soli TaxID=1048753 RepID=A0ABW2U060_9PSEU